MNTLVPGAIGVFDSGYGGLTILSEIRKILPQYDYIYLGDNSRAPYGSRSFEVIYEFTLQAVEALFNRGCNLVILACNTASAKALRSIQQKNLPQINPNKRVLGVIRPTVEIIGSISQTRHVGILGTTGTIQSESYPIEIKKLYSDIVVVGQACPIWATLVENNESDGDGADYFVKKDLDSLFAKDPLIDSIILGCTHYPLLLDKIKKHVKKGVSVIPQGQYIAASLEDYLQRHSEMERNCTKNGTVQYLTTEQPEKFTENASIFLNEQVAAQRIVLE